MRKRMWMGPRGYELWVPMPKIEPAYTRGFWTSQTAHLNGGTTIRASKNAHNVYAFQWNQGSWDDIMPIRDMADGIWDTRDGVNPVYFIEPTSMRRNVLPQAFAVPALASEDAMPLLVGQRPSAIISGPSDWGLPARSAVYRGIGGAPQPCYIPIPPDHTAYFGWVGNADGNGQVQVTDVTTGGGTAGTQSPGALDGSGGVWTNLALPRAGNRIGIQVGIAGTAPLTIRAMTCLVIPNSEVPRTGKPFAGGMGHTGCQFIDKVGLTPSSVPLDRIAAAATLEETGAYL